MITLRPYQIDAVAQIRQAFADKFKAPLYVLPTGGGKTTVFAAIAESSEKRGKRVLILAHRVELVDQIVDRLREFSVNPDIIAAGYARCNGSARASNRAVAVASVQTLVRRLDSYPAPTLIVGDEAHHFSNGNTFSKIVRHYPTARLLGVTATPIRGDGRGLASHFDKLILGPNPAQLMDEGYLVRARVFAPPTVDTSGLHIRAGEFKTEESESLVNTPSITGDVVSHYKQHANGTAALVFCTSVQHAHDVATKFRQERIDAIALSGTTDREVRRLAVREFREGKIKVLCSCDLFSEGFDVSGVHVGILLRPTASLGLFLQQVGRCLRPAPGKSHAIILDHVGNTQRFGLPDEPRDDWELTDDIMHNKAPKKPPPRVCVKCFASSPSHARACAECKHPFKVKQRQEVETVDGQLHEVMPLTPEELARKRERREQGMAQTREQLLAVARIKGWNPRRVDYILAGRERKKLKKETA